MIEGWGPTSGSDVLNVDESGETDSNDGTLTSTTLTGLQMATAGITYTGFEHLNIWLGTAGDRFFVDSTHTGTTQLYAGSGTEAANAIDDQVWVNTTSGVTSLFGEEGNDTIRVNVAPVGSWTFARTHQNGIGAVLNLLGGGGTDEYTVHLANAGDALINVVDQGAPDDGVDTLLIEGADVVAGLANEPDDLFLVRQGFVALINDSDGIAGVSAGDGVERVNYDSAINGRLTILGLGGDDHFVVDDNSAITTLDGGEGNDTFQIGQIFNTPRADIPGLYTAAAHGIADADQFGTTAVVIGIVVVGGTTIFNPVTDPFDQAKADAVNAAIDAALPAGNGVQGIGWLSSGVSFATTVFGGAGADVFSVYRNQAPLRLEGEDGNDEFVVRGFVAVPDRGALAQANTELNGGAGDDLIQYTANAPVSIEGGDGFDSLVVLGTPFPDGFVVTATGIFGAGLTVTYGGVEKVELDTLEGDDSIFVLSTATTVVTTVVGGLGDDLIEVVGDVTEVIRSTIASFAYQPHTLDRIGGPLILNGGRSPDADRSLAPAVMLPTETDDDSVNGTQVDPGTGSDESLDVDRVNVYDDASPVDGTGQLTHRTTSAGVAIENPGYALVGLGMGGDLVLDQGPAGAPDLIRFGGGITYAGFEVVEILLGPKKQSLTIDATPSDVVTVVHGGGDDDTFTVLHSGGLNVVAGPLVLYGDTSENGLEAGGRYSGVSGVASGNALAFSNPGNDTIDGVAAQAVLTIFSGPGDDVLVGGQLGDQIAGGTGDDIVLGQAGDDHIYGDSEFNVDIDVLVGLIRDPLDDTEALEVVSGAAPGSDLIRGDAGNDVLFGDHGEITQTDGTRRILSTANVIVAATTDHALGAIDVIYGNAGDDSIFGGNGADWLYGGNSVGPLPAPFSARLVQATSSTETVIGGHARRPQRLPGPGLRPRPRPRRQRSRPVDDEPGARPLRDHGREPGNRRRRHDPGQRGRRRDRRGRRAGHRRRGVGQRRRARRPGPRRLGRNPGGDDPYRDDHAVQRGRRHHRRRRRPGHRARRYRLRHGAGRQRPRPRVRRLRPSHRDVDAELLPLASATPAFTFASIDTTDAGGAGDVIDGGADDDLLLGQQGDDVIRSAAAATTTSSAATTWPAASTPATASTAAPGFDVIAGDNATILRRGPADLAAASGTLIATTLAGRCRQTAAAHEPDGAPGPRRSTLLDHSATTPAGALRQRLHRGRRRRRHDLRPARQRRDPGRRLDRHVTASAPRRERRPNAARICSDRRRSSAATDGDDYIEGGGGNDVIFGNLGQDDIIGGSSSLFSLTTRRASGPTAPTSSSAAPGTRPTRPQRRR